MKKSVAILLSIAIYIFWGLTPLYWKCLTHVPPFELLANRILWGLLFVSPFFLIRKRRQELKRIVTSDRRSRITIFLAALLIGWNWYSFGVAMVTGRVLESSLAYFLTPLMVILFGVTLLRERLGRNQVLSLCLAGTGILFLLFYLGQPPWLALILSSTFAIYGYLKAKVGITGAVGVGIENAILALPAALYLWSAGAHYDLPTLLLLSLSGPLTVLPLIIYARVVKVVPYSTVGFLQYLSPGFQFFLAIVVYQERFGLGHQVAFSFIWLALVVFTVDLVIRMRRAIATDSAVSQSPLQMRSPGTPPQRSHLRQ